MMAASTQTGPQVDTPALEFGCRGSSWGTQEIVLLSRPRRHSSELSSQPGSPVLRCQCGLPFLGTGLGRCTPGAPSHLCCIRGQSSRWGEMEGRRPGQPPSPNRGWAA
ncbi:hypothetical protein NDU88_002159 [Pleurodeles waltl]|uniref:Uncharacterized protein n=1 Tax=Pleurodeles waltl TaxID=8319 RepID=A0AAV7S9M0_PLEWA|nr:hypothetical protein NDU88_002159 [Pleurodeles waltl]